jgi:hypothetical protein
LINWIVGAYIFAKIWKLILFILLCFGSLLWVLSIIAVLWGITDGFIPAMRKKHYKKASAILAILLITVIVIFVSVNNQAIYLAGFIVPIVLVQLYIKKYIRRPTPPNNFHNN